MKPKFSVHGQLDRVKAAKMRTATDNLRREIQKQFECSELMARQLLAAAMDSVVVQVEIYRQCRYLVTGEIE